MGINIDFHFYFKVGGEPMTIRSIDMQVLVQKTGDVARVQSAKLEEHALRQQDFNQQISKETLKNSSSVNQTLKDEAAYIQEKQEKQNKKRKQKNKEEDKEKAENSDKENIMKNGNRGNNLDILI